MTVAPESIYDIAERYLAWEQDAAYRALVKGLVEAKDEPELEKLLRKPLTFGTAGLRAAMGPGFSRMNAVTVLQASQGIAAHLAADAELKGRGVVIGYDHRYHSEEFAAVAASAFLRHGLKVYLFRQIVPTPLLAYAASHLKTGAAVMVTASHNPKDDNGYKVYWSNGTQIIPPIDTALAASITAHGVPDTPLLSWAELAGATEDPFETVYPAYLAGVKLIRETLVASDHTALSAEAAATGGLTYTAMHGVGTRYVLDAFEAAGLAPPILTREQCEPDPAFPTVVLPNPEEGKGALTLAMAAAEAAGSTVILANDPDADRLAVAEKTPNGWHVFSGDQLGSLMADFLMTSVLGPYLGSPAPGAETYSVHNTVVSSRMLSTMASARGVHYVDTLTGFKWLGNEAISQEVAGRRVLMAYEEAIGFMHGWYSRPAGTPSVKDKDGVSAAVVFATMSQWLAAQGKTLFGHLQDLYATYGLFLTRNSYFICHDPVLIERIFREWREKGGAAPYPTHLGKQEIVWLRDLNRDYDSRTPDNRATLPLQSSQMLSVGLANGIVLTLRTSGTEPKLKYYMELGSKADAATVLATLDETVDALDAEFVRSAHFGIEHRRIVD